ncbi:MAG: QueT transporter family protein [Chloroflexota bacterium]|nr:QueT transporter family protein [Chloroflexota bacterium]
MKGIVTTRRVVRGAIIAALYAVLTVGVAPISYGPVQFRLSEVLKPLVIWFPDAIFGIALGTVVANLLSPYVGAWELVFMPLTDLAGGVLCWWLGRFSPWAGVVAYALTTAASVSLMISVLTATPFLPLLVSIGASELVLLVGGMPLMRFITEMVARLTPRILP